MHGHSEYWKGVPSLHGGFKGQFKSIIAFGNSKVTNPHAALCERGYLVRHDDVRTVSIIVKIDANDSKAFTSFKVIVK